MVNYFKTLNTKNEKALEAKTKELEEINDFKSQFFANISHEIRTPITLIKGQIDELKNQSENNNLLNDIQKNIDYQANKITEIVDNVLDLAKMETSNFKLETQAINISEVIHKTYLSFEPLFKQKTLN